MADPAADLDALRADLLALVERWEVVHDGDPVTLRVCASALRAVVERGDLYPRTYHLTAEEAAALPDTRVRLRRGHECNRTATERINQLESVTRAAEAWRRSEHDKHLRGSRGVFNFYEAELSDALTKLGQAEP